jgi:beta-ureidopropionase / N-carbamoyl-L-amino-acid hydrolase
MHLRRDALVPAARTVDSVRRVAEALDAEGADYFVATVGIVDVAPCASNVVPGKRRLVIDARLTAPDLTRRFVEAIDGGSAAHAEAARVARAAFVTLSDAPPAACDPGLRDELHKSARDLGLSARDLASGVGHDAAFMARICPAAMVFTPCRKGKSHAPEERADREALGAGAAAIYDTVKALDRR